VGKERVKWFHESRVYSRIQYAGRGSLSRAEVEVIKRRRLPGAAIASSSSGLGMV
jgi:hypothetical protein